MECYAKYAAICAISVLMGYALHLGHNGVMLTAAIGVISGLAGYEVAKIKEKRE